VRKILLEQATSLPVYAEYLHRDMFDLADDYGRDTVLLIKNLGTHWLPKFFNIKRQLDAVCQTLPFLPQNSVDKLVYRLAKLFPSQTPSRLKKWNEQYQHQLILTVKGDAHQPTLALLEQVQKLHKLALFECTEKETKSAYLLRFAAAGAAVQYAKVNHQQVEDILALDIALKRNDTDWFEKLPSHITDKLISKLYYGHFLCHVFHQDYLVKKGEDCAAVKAALLELLEQRGAEYPAEHNVGHHYHAKPALADNYRNLDPTNTLNAGIGGMSKKRDYEE
jgi:D-lactate dehydrogenase